MVQVLRKRRIQRAAVCLRVFLQKAHAPLADVAFWHIRHAQEGKVIPIGGKAQIGKRILDFHAVKKLHAAENSVWYLLF